MRLVIPLLRTSSAIQKRRKRIILSDPPTTGKITNQTTINPYRKLSRVEDSQNPLQESMVKTKLLQHLDEKIPTESIKIFRNINLESHITTNYFLTKHVNGSK